MNHADSEAMQQEMMNACNQISKTKPAKENRGKEGRGFAAHTF
jgi:hypothetical protein